ncbi:putative Monoacylglycerol lipase abhd6-B [Cocos nucifera]|uniref:Putative Monoacylglycerol lipase abhd6-B n=1 Tax=Cocos nucifera TaxID=13894 RepID=A0A8K0MWL4_COCNU|nr:putative Monoacylglycerol lipase abhd6-B [Cocos nucifera]
MMTRCLSFTALRDRCYDRTFFAAGLRPTDTVLGDGATVHLWAPRSPNPARPPLLLEKSEASEWLLSSPPNPEIQRSFRHPPEPVNGGARIRFNLQSEDEMKRPLLKNSPCRLASSSLAPRIQSGASDQRSDLRPSAGEMMTRCLSFTALRDRCYDRTFFAAGLRPTDTVLDYVTEKTELINTLIKDRKLSDLPKIMQPTLIIWGEQDKIFPLELGHRLQRHLQENSQLVVIKNAGHAVNLEKSKELCEHIKAFFLKFSPYSHKDQMFILSVFSVNIVDISFWVCMTMHTCGQSVTWLVTDCPFSCPYAYASVRAGFVKEYKAVAHKSRRISFVKTDCSSRRIAGSSMKSLMIFSAFSLSGSHTKIKSGGRLMVYIEWCRVNLIISRIYVMPSQFLLPLPFDTYRVCVGSPSHGIFSLLSSMSVTLGDVCLLASEFGHLLLHKRGEVIGNGFFTRQSSFDNMDSSFRRTTINDIMWSGDLGCEVQALCFEQQDVQAREIEDNR